MNEEKILEVMKNEARAMNLPRDAFTRQSNVN